MCMLFSYMSIKIIIICLMKPEVCPSGENIGQALETS